MDTLDSKITTSLGDNQHLHNHNHHHNHKKKCCGDCKGNGACNSINKTEQFNFSSKQKIETMKAFQKILVPYDFSDYAENALKFATLLCGAHSQITIVNIFDINYVNDPTGLLYFPNNPEELATANKNEVEKLILDLKEWYPKISFDSKIITNEDTAEAICATQMAGDYEVIVIGSHGRKGLQRILMGSVAESVMRGATCPVVVIKK